MEDPATEEPGTEEPGTRSLARLPHANGRPGSSYPAPSRTIT